MGCYMLVIADCVADELIAKFCPEGRGSYHLLNTSDKAWADGMYLASTYSEVIDQGVTEVLLLTDRAEGAMQEFASRLLDLLIQQETLVPVQTYVRRELGRETRVMPCY